MANNTAAIQSLYVAYFNRPADAAGLAYWDTVITAANGSTAAVSAAFAASAEYKAAYAGMDSYHVVAQVYQNLFGHAPDTAGLAFWGQALMTGKMTVDNVVTQIAAGALTTDLAAYNAKVSAATQFTTALNTTALQLGYSGDVANNAAKAWMATITDNTSLTAAIDPAALTAIVTQVTTPIPTPMSLSLTAGVDTIVAGAGNDIINASAADGTTTLTAFDSINGGAGVDTLRFVDINSAANANFSPVVTGATVSNVEKVAVVTTGAASFDITGWKGVTDLNVTAAGTNAEAITAADTTNVTVASATQSTTTITGGKAVVLAQSDATAGAVSVTGAGLTTVSITGGASATVDNQDATAASGKGTTFTAATIDGVKGSIALKGASLTNVTLKNMATAAGTDNTVTITNNTASHTLNLTVDTAGKAGTANTTVVDAKADVVSVNAAGKSSLIVTAAAATHLNVSGAAASTIDATGSVALTTVDASANAGGVTLKNLSSTVTSITGGAGNDSLTVTTATVKADATNNIAETDASVVTGAGNDTITINNATGNGKFVIDAGVGNDTVNVTARGTAVLNVSLGDGNDTFTSAVAINGTDVIDAGAGSDTLMLSLVGSANIGAFSNFDMFDAKSMAKTLDVDILASKNNVTEFVASGDVGANAVLINIGSGINFRATGDMTTADALSLTQKTGGALTVTLDADSTSTTAANNANLDVHATNATSLTAVFNADSAYTTAANTETIKLAGDLATSLNIVSGGSHATNVLNYIDGAAKLVSVTASGASNLDLTQTTAMTAVTSVDASAMTGKLSIDLAKIALGSATVALGSAADTVTVSATASNATAFDALSGFQKASAIAVSTTADATAKSAAIAAADQLVVTGGTVEADSTTTHVKSGVLTFSGAGPSTLADAIILADAATATTGHAVVFEYLGNSYVFVQGAATGTVDNSDVVVKLVGATGIQDLGAGAAGHFFLV
jgi:hypothetical protein